MSASKSCGITGVSLFIHHCGHQLGVLMQCLVLVFQALCSICRQHEQRCCRTGDDWVWCAGDGLSWHDVDELLMPVATPPKCATSLNQSMVPG